MELQDYNYETLPRDPSSKSIQYRFTLSEIPSKEWTSVFNRVETNYEFYSIEDSKAIIVTLSPMQSVKTDYFSELLDTIVKADKEIASDTIKESIYKKVFRHGVVICHDGLKYDK